MSNAAMVALYARVSSEQQSKRGTIDSQIAALKERIQADGAQIVEDMCFVDAGVSGATLVRPQLERLRDAAALGAIDRLYILSPDRLARKYAYQALLMEELGSYGVQVVFLNHAIGTTPEESLLLQMQGMISEYERAKIAERNRRGKLHGAKRGTVNVLSGAPYGYRYIRRQLDGTPARYVIELPQAATVKAIFEWVGLERLSLGDVIRRLGEAGTVTASGKPYWDRSVVWGILRNPAYISGLPISKMTMLFVLSEYLVHHGDFVKGKKAAPDDGRSRRTVMLAREIAAESCDPQDNLSERGRFIGRFCGAMHSAIQGTPLDRLQQYFARQFTIKPGKQHGIQDSPTDHREQGRGTEEPVEIAKLSGFNATATLEHAMPRFDRPSTRIPRQTLEGLCLRVRGHRSQQKPLQWLNPFSDVRFKRVDREHLDPRKLLAATIARWTKVYGNAPHFKPCGTCRPVLTRRHLQLCFSQHRGGHYRFPQIFLRVGNEPVPRRTNQPIDTGGPFGQEHIVDIAFTITYADDMRVRAVCLKYGQLLATLEPFRALLLAYRPLSAQVFLATLLWPAYPGLHTHHAERQAFRRESEQAMHQETAYVRTRTASQTFGRAQMGQIEFRGVLRGQYNRDLLHSTQRLADMGTQHAVDIDLRIIEKAVGRLQFRTIKRLRKRAMRPQREPASQRHEPSGQANVAQLGCAKLFVCPISEIIGVRQCPAPRFASRSEVNINRRRLQARSF
jgi:DNA invertase Pin-like site-specific DNA recombinase